MVTITKVPRKETHTVQRATPWILIYGRRKVGKTYMVRNFIDHDMYFLIKRGGGAFIEKKTTARVDDYNILCDMIIDALKDGKRAVVDEFQRLPAEFIDRLQLHHPAGKLILMGSSLHVARDLTSRRSPLLGLMSEIRLSLISPSDIFSSLAGNIGAENALALSPYLRDPWTLKYLEGTPERTILRIMEYSKNAIPALIGEAFIDEDRFLSEVYEGVIRSIASGKNTLGEVSDQLYSNKLIPANNPSLVRPYVKNMENMDLIERVPLFGKRGYYYTVRSKVMDLYYYLDAKYGPEADSPRLIKEVVGDRSPIHIQLFLGELMAELLDGTFQYKMTKDFDIDIIITRRNKPVFAAEVKWSKNVKLKEVYKFLENSADLDCRKALISRTPVKTDELEVITPEILLKMVSKK